MTFHSTHDDDHLYFLTAATCGWKPLFDEPAYAKIVLNSLEWLRSQERMALYAYTLMPTHLHALIKPVARTISNLIQTFGSFTAHAILKQLRSENRTDLLDFFHSIRRDPRHQHSIWQDIQAINIFSLEVLSQKVEYIHNNPIDGEWSLCADRADYEYSSACFYDRDENPIVLVDDVRELF